jgi:hypothetical protein
MLAARFTDLKNVVLLMYKGQSRLFYRNAQGDMEELASMEGSRQGCVFGGLIFNFGIHPTLVRISRAFAHKDLNIVAIADDITLVGPDDVCREAYAMLVAELAVIGLEMQPTKVKVWSHSSWLERPEDAKAWQALSVPADDEHLIPASGGLRIAGVPIGSNSFCRQYCLDFVNVEVRAKCAALLKAEQVQDAMIMLRQCVNASMVHLLRTVPPRLVHDAALMFDVLVHATFVEITGTDIPFDSAAWDAMRFPLRHGGFGLTSMLRISHAAYFASQIQVLQNGMLDGKFGQRVADLLAPIYGNLGKGEVVGTIEHDVQTSWQFLHDTYGNGFSTLLLPAHFAPPDVEKVKSLECLFPPSVTHPGGLGSVTCHEKWQREISHMIHRYEFVSFMQSEAPNMLKARVREACLPGGSTFATMMPSCVETTIPSEAFVSFLCHKYAVSDPTLSLAGLFSGSMGGSCPLFSKTGNNCGAPLCDQHMRHCQFVLHGPNSIHDAIVRWLTKLLASVCGSAISELEHDVPDSNKKPYDSLGAPGVLKKRAHDVVIRDSSMPSHAEIGAKNPTTNIRSAEQRKLKQFSQYATRARSVKLDEFAPFALSGVGSVGEYANETLRAIAKAAIPGPDVDPQTRLRRAMWLSAKRKELMCVFARNFHYVVTAKHQLVAKALKKERHLGCDVESIHGREAIPEDVGVFGAIDEDGNEFLNLNGRAGDVRLVAPAPTLPVVPEVVVRAPLPPGMPPPGSMAK